MMMMLLVGLLVLVLLVLLLGKVFSKVTCNGTADGA